MRFPRSRGSRIYLAQLLTVAVGLLLIAVDAWRLGVGVIGASFIVAACLRALVTPEEHGMLRVRGKVFDVGWMLLLGVALVALAIVVPPQPPL
ncbi:DUF3017 domain-containing protein [uncultured Aeromicrobium sp.]|uniref:DUF3017 domain-containing protein n=1 Tax=uncultured Aeromicrobium sp. TaxID=337820 RepID=UPI0025CD0B0E|nr:DUF3017 domain-containing protein [uncultured Aeromicrobium sp.]